MASSRSMHDITFRKLHAADRTAFDAHLLALDSESRRLRFGMTTSDEFLHQYAERCATLNAIIHGAFDGERLIGVAELRPLGELHNREAEIAFSVVQDWRNCGIGTVLFARTLRSARNRGYSRLYMSCLKYNQPMQALARKFASDISVEVDESFALVEAPRRTIISLIREAWDDASEFTALAFDWQKRALHRKDDPSALAS